MSLRLAALAAFVAALPISVDAPSDSTGGSPGSHDGGTRVEAMGGVGQYGIVTRGCEGQTISVLHRQLASGGLVVEHETPAGLVLGVRGGAVEHSSDERRADYGYGNVQVIPAWTLTNRYVNPFVAYESRWSGAGVGWLSAQEPFVVGERDPIRPTVTGHLRFGDREGKSFTLRFMEDVPLESEGHLSVQLGLRPARRFDLDLGVGVMGPFDGALIGAKGRFWLTPAAAAQVRAGVSGNQQYVLLGGVAARWPAPR